MRTLRVIILGNFDMPIHNATIAEIFNRVADLLEVEGANQFRVRAYRNAARLVESRPQPLANLIRNEREFPKLAGIGEDLKQKIVEICEHGRLKMLDDLERRVPPGILTLLKVPGLGPKRAKVLFDQFHIDSLTGLADAAKKGRIHQLPGFGEKTEQNILRAIEYTTQDARRIKLSVAREVAESLVAYLQSFKGTQCVLAAGSYRRRLETIGDLDLLATSRDAPHLMDHFIHHDDMREVVSHGKTRSTIILGSELHVDLRVVPEKSYGAALHYFTGSKAHNIAVRTLGQKRGLKINEYGVFRGSEKGPRLAAPDEIDVFARVGLPYIEPELREDRGEIQAAQRNALPQLLTEKDIHGDLHSHTKTTDGRSTLEQMAAAAEKLGYEYLALTDHTRHLTVAKGLDPTRLMRQIREVDRLNEKLDKLKILKSAEVDILEDGSLDLPESVLKHLDLTVCSIHSRFELPEEKQTDRVLRAMDHRSFSILGHPLGRLIGGRRPLALNLEKIMKAAKEYGCFLELNSQPDRLDLPDIYCKMAKELGVKIAISTDAHSTDELNYMWLGVAQARRGWLEREDVLNTRPLKDLLRLLRK